MVGYSDALYHHDTGYHLKNEQVKVHYSDVSTIQNPTVHKILTVHRMPTACTNVPLCYARLPTFFQQPLKYAQQ